MPPKPLRSFVVLAASGLAFLMAGAAHADTIIIWQNGFESADTCAWAKTKPSVTCDPEMVFVPAGEFTMGEDDRNTNGPVHTVSLSAYWIDRTAVTLDDYTACMTAGGCAAPNGEYALTAEGQYCNWGAPWSAGGQPINCVDWDHALAYCVWGSKRLPTEAEWEKAARGVDARIYPWGDETPSCDYAVLYPGDGGPTCASNHTDPVGTKPAGASPYGALDMTGNIYQWVLDWYDEAYYSISPYANPPGPLTSPFGSRVYRGSPWFISNGDFLHSSERNYLDPAGWGYSLGFRCARDG